MNDSKNFVEENELANIDKVISILDHCSVQYWLDQGSLLGAIRDGNFFSWDHDIDIGVLHDDIKGKENLIVNKLRGMGCIVTISGYAIKVTSLYRDSVKSVDLRIYKKNKENLLAELRSSFGDSKIYYKIRYFKWKMIVYLHRINHKFNTRIMGWLIDLIVRFLNFSIEKNKSRIVFFKVDSRYFIDFTEINLYNRKFTVPVLHNEYLEFKYGENWKIPCKDWRYWEHDGALDRVIYK